MTAIEALYRDLGPVLFFFIAAAVRSKGPKACQRGTAAGREPHPTACGRARTGHSTKRQGRRDPPAAVAWRREAEPPSANEVPFMPRSFAHFCTERLDIRLVAAWHMI